jgi:hypothetical protein
MKSTNKFSFILSAFAIISVISVIVGYLLGKNVKQTEGFLAGEIQCNVCRKPRPNCGCSPAVTSNCGVCSMPKPNCSCPNHVVGPYKKEPKQQKQPPVIVYASPDQVYPPATTCPTPDTTKYVLKTSIPPCPPMPDMNRYMLKTECPSQPDMSKYVLKSSVPKCPPCIASCSKPCKIGECPPCPRARCPVVKCPEPKACPACPSVQVASCPEPNVQCKAAYEPNSQVRPMLASTASFGL